MDNPKDNEETNIKSAKPQFNIKKLVIPSIAFILIGGLTVAAYSFGYNNKDCPAPTEPDSLTYDCEDSTPTKTITDESSSDTDDTTTTETTSTDTNIPISDNVETFNYDDLVNASREEAIDNITKAFSNISALDSIGYHYVICDGDEACNTFDAKYKSDTENDLLLFEKSNIINTGMFIGSSTIASEVGHKDIYSVGNGDKFAISLIFEENYDLLNHAENISFYSDSYYHLSEFMPTYDFTVKSLQDQIVEYTFYNDTKVGGANYYRINIGADGLIYHLQIPFVYSFIEYSNIEYNKAYDIQFKPVDMESFDMNYRNDIK